MNLGKDNGLFPCPFCGSIEGGDLILGYKYPKYRITCIGCDIIMLADRKDKIIAHWNHRVLTPCKFEQ